VVLVLACDSWLVVSYFGHDEALRAKQCLALLLFWMVVVVVVVVVVGGGGGDV
jgi:hypothetical protein